jgi:hypothetical protein
MKSYRSIALLVLPLLLICTACNAPFGRGESLEDPSQAEEEKSQSELPTSLEKGSTFILVVDPSGDPISDARIGDSELYTDGNGISVGLISTTPSG